MYVAKLQKTQSVLINGFKLMTATEGVDHLEQTQFWKDIEFNGDTPNPESIVTSIKKNLSKYFKISDACYGTTENSCPMYSVSYSLLNGSSSDDHITGIPYFQLQDGTVFYLFDTNDQFMMVVPDINGQTGPNTVGRDTFMYYIISDYKFLSLSGDYEKETEMKILTYLQFVNIEKGLYSDLPVDDRAINCGDLGSSDISRAEGTFCIDRIMEEGWKMNY